MSAMDSVERWGRFEAVFQGPETENPFVDVSLRAEFRLRNRVIAVDGFYDGGTTYKLRFMPDTEGTWSYTTHSNFAELDGIHGEIQVTAASAGNHGPVHVKDKYRFVYEDGTPYLPFGTTLYHWVHHGNEEREQSTLADLSDSSFNKVRMIILPTGTMDPPSLAFAGNLSSGVDTQRFNPDFFAHFERRVEDLQRLGIEADIILFHPYDQNVWGFQKLDPETEELYLRYVIARMASYRNVWWSLANEFDFNVHKTTADWDRLLQFVQHHDPYGHLRSIHNGTKMYDYSRTSMYDYTKPWVTHQSIQHWETSLTSNWLETCPKPVVVDECCYEGNAPRRWGNISGEELVRRFWECMVRGGYAAHGEAFVGDSSWISSGGKLAGESPARIAFLRELMEEHQADLWNTGSARDCYWLYFGISRPAYWELDLPADREYYVELIDTWEMHRERLPGTYSGPCQIPLTGKSYTALRLTRV
ncbi:DUF5060 domain-containing protein [Paenibacillus sp. NPDC056579]|uniref:DUF5060 domain-containing protein n=1 Tax=Paenibacillus sp. NPDC056579 TaxID=3345871 RepID=UPI0036D0930F